MVGKHARYHGEQAWTITRRYLDTPLELIELEHRHPHADRVSAAVPPGRLAAQCRAPPASAGTHAARVESVPQPGGQSWPSASPGPAPFDEVACVATGDAG